MSEKQKFGMKTFVFAFTINIYKNKLTMQCWLTFKTNEFRVIILMIHHIVCISDLIITQNQVWMDLYYLISESLIYESYFTFSRAVLINLEAFNFAEYI